MHTTAE